MATDFQTQLKIIAEGIGFAKVEQQINKLSDKTDSFGKNIEKLGRSFTGLSNAISTVFGVASIKAFDDQEKAIAKIRAGLQSTGESAGFTAEELIKISEQLQTITRYADEEILGDVTAQLLTFTNIAGEAFERTQIAVLDLASKLDGDLKSASIQLGKALNDPVANLSALSRSGIQFSEEQKNTINTLVEQNRLFDAQTLILDELEKQYGGTATALAKVGVGPIIQLKNAFGDLQEDIGKILNAFLIPLVNGLQNLTRYFKNLTDDTKAFIIQLGILATVIGPVTIGIGLLLSNISLFINPITLVVAAFVLLTDGIRLLDDTLGSLDEALFSIISGTLGLLGSQLLTLANLIVLVVDGWVKLGNLVGVVSDKATKDVENFRKGIVDLRDTLLDFSKEEFKNSVRIFTDEDVQDREIASFGSLLQNWRESALKTFDEISNDFNKITNDGNNIGEETFNPEGLELYGNRLRSIRDEESKTNEQRKQDAKKALAEYEISLKTLSQTGQILTNSFTNAFESIIDGTKSVGNAFKDLARNILRSLTNQALQGAFGSLFAGLGFNQAGQGPLRRATGGYVSGPGSSTSDSIPAYLSNGEYVLNAKSVSLLGRGILDNLNSLGRGFYSRSRRLGFADGGQVSGSGVTVNVVNNTGVPVSARSQTRFDGRQLIIDTILEDQSSNGPISQSMQNVFGVRR